MGLDYSYYIGPYLKCDWHYKKEDVVLFGCPKCSKEKLPHDFCSTCGTKLRSFTISGNIKSYDFDCEDFDELFASTGEIIHIAYDLLVLNYRTIADSTRDLYINCCGEVNYEVFPAKVQAEVESFKQLYRHDIEKVREKYDNVEVNWGIVTILS